MLSTAICKRQTHSWGKKNPSCLKGLVRGDILVYKNEIVVKIKLKVLFNKSGKMNLKIFNLCNEDVFF